jgi:hypothetical protein
MAVELAVVADAEVDPSAALAPGTRASTSGSASGSASGVASGGVRAVRPAGTIIHRPVRMRPVRLVRAGDRRRPGHVVTVPARRAQSVACAPRSRGASLGWLALTAGLVALIVVGIGWLGSFGGTAATPVPATTTVVTVHSGETLWNVATSEAPSSSPQDVVDRIRELNHIFDAAIYPGERLVVPVETTN